MRQSLLIVLSLIWLVGTWLRIYRQARFYQIEEYMSRRYLSWIRRHSRQLFPRRPILAWLIGTAILLLVRSSTEELLPPLIAILAAAAACMPPKEREIKKSIVLTGRLKRILAAAAALSALGAYAAIQVVLAVLGPSSTQIEAAVDWRRRRGCVSDGAALFDNGQPAAAAL